MKALLLRLDAPLMSFGGTIVDQNGFTDPFPGLSLLVGMFANALGYDRSEATRHEALQARLLHAVRRDRDPERLIDYHTVDLGQPHLLVRSWTTRGVVDERAGGAAAQKGTHIRYRHYWADGVFTVGVALSEGDGPTLEELDTALRSPARPLSIGRRPCLPSGPLSQGVREGHSLLSILAAEPLHRPRRASVERVRAWWPAALDGGERFQTLEVADQRDWTNQIHVGRRQVAEGWLALATEGAA